MENLLVKIADCINKYAVLVEATVPEQMEEYRTVEGTEIKVCMSKVLHIAVKRMYGKYANGQEWKIFQKDVEKAVASLGRKDKRLTERIHNEKLTAKDCERIIKKASYNLISLPLAR